MYVTFIKKKTIKLIAVILVAVLVVITLTSVTGAHAVFYGGNLKKLPVYYVKTEKKKIAISFDCAWGVDYTDKLLEIMKNEEVKCTFFTVEFWTEKYPEYVKKISEHGHEIGTHSATHPHLSKMSEKAIEKELSTSKLAIEKITGKQVNLFRAPFGEYNDKVIDVANKMGLYVIQWDVDSLDWKNLSSKEIEKRVLSKVKNGSIVLFHNQGLHTHEALEGIIRQLKQRGYEFCSIGDLIYKDNYKIAVDGGQYLCN